MRRLAFALLLILPACDDGTPAVTVRDQASVVAEAACAGAFACDCGNAFTADYADEATCVEGITELLVDRALDDVGLSFNGECADRVAAALSSYACETADDASVSQSLFAAADQLRECRLFYGSAGAGESCERLDGGLGDSCDIAHFCADGTCVAAAKVHSKSAASRTRNASKRFAATWPRTCRCAASPNPSPATRAA